MAHSFAETPRLAWRTLAVMLFIAGVVLCAPAFASAVEVAAPAAEAPPASVNEFTDAPAPAPAPVEPAPADPPPVASTEPPLPPPATEPPVVTTPVTGPVHEVPVVITPDAPAPAAPALPSAPPDAGGPIVPATPDPVAAPAPPAGLVAPTLGAPDPIVPATPARVADPPPAQTAKGAPAVAPRDIFHQASDWGGAVVDRAAEIASATQPPALPTIPGVVPEPSAPPVEFVVTPAIVTVQGLFGILASRVIPGDLGMGAATLVGLPQLLFVLVLFAFLFAGITVALVGGPPVTRLRGHRAVVFRPG